MRVFAAAALLFAATAAALAQSNEQPGPPPKLVKIKDDLYMVENVNANLADLVAYGGNVTLYLTNGGVIMVDSKFDRNHDDLMAKVKSLTDKPVKYVVLTHNHAYHAGGAEKMEAAGATIVISADDRDNMLRAPGQSWLPQLGYIGQARVTVGGKEAQLHQMRGHTRGDTVVYFPAARVVAAGDLLTTADTIPLIVNYADGGNWTDWSKSADEILKLDFDVLIPGHGPAINKQQLREIRTRFVAIQERVRVLNREKKTQEEISQTLIREFNWGAGPSAGNLPGMMQEFR